MTLLIYNSLDLAIIFFELFVVMVIGAIIKGWIDNRRWEKHIYQILEQYRAKYGVDEGCEMLMYKELSEND